MKFLYVFIEMLFETPVKNCFLANWKRASGGVLKKKKKIKFVEPIHGPALFS